MCKNPEEKHCVFEKGYIWNPPICSCENGKDLVSIVDLSVIMSDKIIDTTKSTATTTVPTNFNQKRLPVNKKLYILILIFINYHRIIGSC